MLIGNYVRTMLRPEVFRMLFFLGMLALASEFTTLAVTFTFALLLLMSGPVEIAAAFLARHAQEANTRFTITVFAETNRHVISRRGA